MRRSEELAHVGLPGDDDTVSNRRSGVGALLGIAAGLGTGAVWEMAARR